MILIWKVRKLTIPKVNEFFFDERDSFAHARYSVLEVLDPHPYYSHQSSFVGINRGCVRDCRGGAAVAVRQWSRKTKPRKARPAFRRGTPRESSRDAQRSFKVRPENLQLVQIRQKQYASFKKSDNIGVF